MNLLQRLTSCSSKNYAFYSRFIRWNQWDSNRRCTFNKFSTIPGLFSLAEWIHSETLIKMKAMHYCFVIWDYWKILISAGSFSGDSQQKLCQSADQSHLIWQSALFIAPHRVCLAENYENIKRSGLYALCFSILPLQSYFSPVRVKGLPISWAIPTNSSGFSTSPPTESG